MPIETTWENNENRVIICAYSGRWSLDEFYQSVLTCNQLMDSVAYPVNVIFDMSKSISLPNGFMGAISSLSKKPHPNLGTMAIVGANKLVQIFNDLVIKVYKRELDRTTYMVRTREDAHEVFRQRAL